MVKEGSSDYKKVGKRWFFKEPLTELFFVEPKMVLLWHCCEEPFKQGRKFQCKHLFCFTTYTIILSICPLYYLQYRVMICNDIFRGINTLIGGVLSSPSPPGFTPMLLSTLFLRV